MADDNIGREGLLRALEQFAPANNQNDDLQDYATYPQLDVRSRSVHSVDMESDDISPEEQDEYIRKGAEGAAARNGESSQRLPEYIVKYFESKGPVFQEYWLQNKNFSSEFQSQINSDVATLHSKYGVDATSAIGQLQFDQWNQIKSDVLELYARVDLADPNSCNLARQVATEKTADFMNQAEIAGFPRAILPPHNWIEILGKERLKAASDPSPPSGTINPAQSTSTAYSTSNTTSKSSPTPRKPNVGGRNQYDDTIQSIARSSGVRYELKELETVVGWCRCGTGYEVLVKEGIPGAEKFQIVSSKDVPGFTENIGIKLSAKQRGLLLDENGIYEYSARDLEGLKGVAWRYNDETDPDNIALDMETTGDDTFPITRVLVWWKDGLLSWETRTTIRRFYTKRNADMFIYEAALRQEMRYLDAIPEEVFVSTGNAYGSIRKDATKQSRLLQSIENEDGGLSSPWNRSRSTKTIRLLRGYSKASSGRTAVSQGSRRSERSGSKSARFADVEENEVESDSDSSYQDSAVAVRSLKKDKHHKKSEIDTEVLQELFNKCLKTYFATKA